MQRPLFALDTFNQFGAPDGCHVATIWDPAELGDADGDLIKCVGPKFTTEEAARAVVREVIRSASRADRYGLILDEAWRYARNRGGQAAAWNELYTCAAHWGIWLVYTSQRPAQTSLELRANTDAWFIHRIVAPQDLQWVSPIVGAQAHRVPGLRTGQALFVRS